MNKKNLIPIIVLVVLVIAYIIIKTNDNVEKRFQFFGVDSVDITGFELISKEDTLRLSKTETGWLINYPVEYPPAKSKIQDLFSKVITAETSNIPISESDNAFETFNLTDSLGTIIKIIGKNDKTLSEAIVGRSSNYNYSNARYYNDNKIYQLTSNITYNLSPKLTTWRQKEIIEVNEEDIAQIEVSFNDTLYTITPTDTLWLYQGQGQEFAIQENNGALKGILNNAKRLRASSFIDDEYDKYAAGFSSPVLSLKVRLFNNDEILCTFSDFEENKYLIKRNEETATLFVVYGHMVKNFKKPASEFKT